MLYPEEQTWAIIRHNAHEIGWPVLIWRQNQSHFIAVSRSMPHPQQEMLHDFYEKAATQEEQKTMLRCGFMPRC